MGNGLDFFFILTENLNPDIVCMTQLFHIYNLKQNETNVWNLLYDILNLLLKKLFWG